MKKKIRTEKQRFSHLLIITANLLHLAAYSILRGFFFGEKRLSLNQIHHQMSNVDKYSH